MKATAALLLLGLAGCGTIVDIAGGGPFKERGPHVFGGVRTDVAFSFGGELCCVMSGMAPFFLFDLPISAAADVVMLPVTVPLALFAPQRER